MHSVSSECSGNVYSVYLCRCACKNLTMKLRHKKITVYISYSVVTDSLHVYIIYKALVLVPLTYIENVI